MAADRALCRFRIQRHAGLMCAICLGRRQDQAPPHNMVLTFTGASLLWVGWVGWFGFNAGSAVSSGTQDGLDITRHGEAIE